MPVQFPYNPKVVWGNSAALVGDPPPPCDNITVVDYSGNGRHGTLTSTFPAELDGNLHATGLVSGDDALRLYDDSGDPIPASGAGLSFPYAFDLSGSFTFEAWVMSIGYSTEGFFGGSDGDEFMVLTQSDPTGPTFLGGLQFIVSGSGAWGTGRIHPDSSVDPAVFFPDDDAGHHIVAVFDASEGAGNGTGHIYLDGSEVLTYGGNGIPGRGSGPYFVQVSGRVVDEFAVYEHALSGGAVASHYAAGGSFGGYAAAVLGDSPAGYYHLNESCPG